MKILIISDIHGAIGNAESVLRMHPKTEYLLFLGDGVRDFYDLSERFPLVGFIGVRGNCDLGFLSWRDGLPTERVNTIGGVRIFMCHGHTVGVKDEALGTAAERNGADVAMYGHTHIPHKGIYTASNGRNITVFNPGSIGSPRGGSVYSYGVMEITGGEFTISHMEL